MTGQPLDAPVCRDVALLVAGDRHACALTAAGVAYCWGAGSDGALGDGTFADHSTPHAVTGGLTFKAIASGDHFTCALDTKGAAYCWGVGVSGELGDNTVTSKLVPTAVRIPTVP